MDELAALLPFFLDETIPLVDALGPALVAIAEAWTRGARDAVAERRALGDVHTAKGNAAMMAFEPIQQVAHALEDLLESGGAPSAPRGALLVRGGDLLQGLVYGCDGGALDELAARRFVDDVAAHLAGVAATAPAPLRVAPIGRPADAIRVPLPRLDELARLADRAAADPAAIAELRDGLAELRHVPLSTIFDRFGRHVRELARERSRAVRLELRGGDTRLDKAIVDRLGEPLLHLVRNAIAHGIEPSEARAAAGKPPVATIALTAAARGDRVIVAVEDDGRGVDPAAIEARARALGIDVDALTADDRRRLVFLPGLSTAAAVTALAGRGVGLDVVAGTIAALGGVAEVESVPGAGARFWFELPRTIAGEARPLHDLGERLDAAEREVARLSALYVATCQLHAARDRAGVERAIADVTVHLIGAERHAVLVRGAGGWDVAVAEGLADEPAFAGGRYLGGDATIDASLADGALRLEPERGGRALAAIPLVDDGVVVGAIAIHALVPHRAALDDDDRELCAQVAAHAAAALTAGRAPSARSAPGTGSR